MLPVIHSRAYEYWALMIARWFLALQFSVAAFFKITAFSMQTGAAAAAGVPLPAVAVALGLILEVAGVIALLTGYYLKTLALLLALYVGLLGVLFYNNWSDPMTFGLFISHLGLMAALFYVSVFSPSSSGE